MRNDRIAETIPYRGYKILIEYDNETFDFYDDEHLGHFVYRRGAREYVGDTPMTEEAAYALLFTPREDDETWCRLNDEYEDSPYNSQAETQAKASLQAREVELKEMRRPDIISRSMHVSGRGGCSARGYDQPADPDEDTDFVYCTHDEARKFLRVNDKDKRPLTPDEIRQAEKILLSEVKELDYWCTGQVYGYRIIDDCDNEVDACWRFVGESKYCEEEASAACDRLPLLLGTRQQFVDKAKAKMHDRPNVRMDNDPCVERVKGTRTAWVQAWALIDLDEEV